MAFPSENNWIQMTNMRPVGGQEGEDCIDRNFILDGTGQNGNVVPPAEPIHPSAIDFSRISVNPTRAYRSHSNTSEINLKEISDLAFQNVSNGNVKRRSEPETTSEVEGADKKTKSRPFVNLREATTLLVVAAGIIGLIIIIIVFKDISTHTEPQQEKRISSTGESTCYLASGTKHGFIEFNSSIDVFCHTNTNITVGETTVLTITYKPHNLSSWISGSSFEVMLNKTGVTSGLWTVNISAEPTQTFSLTRGPVKCDSGGIYQIKLLDDGETLMEENIGVTIESNISDIELTVGQSGGENASAQEISCSSKNGCSPTPIMLLGETDGEVVPLYYGVNFTCLMQFTYTEGWTGDCSGFISTQILSSLENVVCRHVHGNETVVAEREAKIPVTAFCNGEDCNG